LTKELGTSTWRIRALEILELINPKRGESSTGLIKHARVIKVRRLSKRYLLAELELLEPLDAMPKPTQFVMIWIPGVDYIPMSIADYDTSRITVFFAVRGEGTEALSNSAGRVVGVVGPLGKALTINSKASYVLVAGGTGLAPIIRIAKELSNLGISPAVVWGTRRSEDVGEVPRYFREVTGIELSVCTEDCGIGYCGRATDYISHILPSLRDIEVIAAGPNDMLVTIANLGFKAGIDPVLILESRVNCGLGICGSCVLGNSGSRLCREGPAFRASEVINYLVNHVPSKGKDA